MVSNRLAVVAVAVALAASGCAFGRKVQFVGPGPDLGVDGYGPLAVAVQDQRPAVLDRDKDPQWVGFLRSGYGIPYNVSTATGHPLAEDVSDILAPALTLAGFDVSTVRVRDRDSRDEVLDRMKRSGSRGVLVTIYEWKADQYAYVGLHYDLELLVLDEAGEAVAETAQDGHLNIGTRLGDSAFYMRRALCLMLAEESVSVALGRDPKGLQCEDVVEMDGFPEKGRDRKRGKRPKPTRPPGAV